MSFLQACNTDRQVQIILTSCQSGSFFNDSINFKCFKNEKMYKMYPTRNLSGYCFR